MSASNGQQSWCLDKHQKKEKKSEKDILILLLKFEAKIISQKKIGGDFVFWILVSKNSKDHDLFLSLRTQFVAIRVTPAPVHLSILNRWFEVLIVRRIAIVNDNRLALFSNTAANLEYFFSSF